MIDSNSPANSEFVVIILATAGLETDAVLKDKTDFTALVAGTTNEVTNSGYARKHLTDVDTVAFAPDMAGDQLFVDVPD